jgi:CheY-like chemotaxis protein
MTLSQYVPAATSGRLRGGGNRRALLQGIGPSENIPLHNDKIGIDDVMKKETILLVDDDEPVLSMLARSLEESYHVLVATNGIAGVYAYEQHAEVIVAIVTDLEMPRLDGAAFAEWVRHINPKMPIIIMSGSVADGRISELLQRPGIAFLAKPFLPVQIERMLHSLGVVSESVQPAALTG